jgi:SAM-dependent methyltransferase
MARRRPRYTAATADKYALYQKAVQSPDLDVELLERIFRSERGRAPRTLREDFCGTALISSAWLRRDERNRAEGFDIDPEPVAWGLAHNFQPGDAERFTLHLADVRSRGRLAPDLRIAFNFSYWVFATRAELLDYFRAARESLAPDGVFVIDLYGGGDATEELEERRRCGGFTYVWDQARYWPGTAEYTCHIRFEFPNGTSLKAFTYRWRFWNLSELRDVLLDAGFARVDTYFEGPGEKDEGDGDFRKRMRGENCAAWLAYLVALR